MRKPFLIFAAVFGITYVTVERAGLFSDMPQADLQIFYSVPILAVSFIITSIVSAAAVMKRKSLHVADWFGMAAVLLIAAGLWIGYFTRFSAEVVLTEGQDFYSGHAVYVPETVYRGRFSTPPDFGLRIEKLSPSFSADGQRIERIQGDVKFFTKENTEPLNYVFTDGLPKVIRGTMFTLNDFGYSPRYELKTREGKNLDSSFIYMRLFPPGNEDSFRLLSPLTYYLRYYPEGRMHSGEPLFRFRVVRNKDVVLNRDIKMSENVDFENSRISFEEVRMWTKLSVKHDYGEFLLFAGLITGLIYAAAAWTRKFRRNDTGSS